jgi:tRNA-Thr(GGU) m(6)t(6)A37 methyltransferase TsaA
VALFAFLTLRKDAMTAYMLEPIGVVRSTLTARENAPLQGDEGAPEAWLELNASVTPGLKGISVGDELLVLTWLHQGQRDVLQVHPRGNPANPLTGVFATRSPDRPNPIGLHRVRVLEIVDGRLRVEALEAIDGTPIIDIKPVLGQINER